jgi:hypothetical protein
MAHDPTYNLLHTQVRYDKEGLNTEAETDPWIAAEDADNFDVDWGTVFRIRWRISESAGNGTSNTFKVQFNLNSTGWVDCQFLQNAGATAVMSVFSEFYADGDAITTEFLTTGGTFINGEGDENENSLSSTIDSQQTELESAHMIMSYYGNETDGPSKIADNDSIEFRLVEGDGTAFTGSENTVTILVNAVDYYVGGTYAEAPVRIGPFIDEGNLYAAIEFYATSDADWGIIKSTDGGKTWAEQDGTNRPTNGDLESIDIVQDGDTLYIIHKESGTGVWHHSFRTSSHSTNPDTWNVTDESVASVAATNYSVAIESRSDGTLVGAYRRTNGSFQHLYYKIRNGTWGGENNLDVTASTNFTGLRLVKEQGSDKIHIFYNDATNLNLIHRSLSDTDTLSGPETAESDTPNHEATTPAVAWTAGGSEEVMIGVMDNSDSLLYSVAVTDDGSPETRKQISAVAITADPGATGSDQPVADMAVDQATDTVFSLFSDSSSGDLWRDEAINDGGWGTDAEQLDDKTIHWVRGKVFTHSVGNGGNKVLGFLYDNGSGGDTGFIWYDEHILPSDASDIAPVARTVGRKLNQLLRM